MRIEKQAALAGLLTAAMNSFVLDYVARQSVGGTHLNFFILKQLPVPAPSTFTQPCPWVPGIALAEWMLPRVLELTYTAVDIEPYARDLGYDGPPFRWEDERRFWLRAELDAAFFHLYGIDRDDVAYIMETFPIVKRKDIAAHGSYRTKEAILSIYDEMAVAFGTRLNPPPANGWTPPPLPPLEDLLAATATSSEATTSKKRNPAKVGAAPPVPGGTAAAAPRMANLFEKAPDTLFDAVEDSEPEPEPVPEPPKPIGPIVINGQPAQLVEKKVLDSTRTQYMVILDSTGELKSFISPPATVTGSESY